MHPVNFGLLRETIVRVPGAIHRLAETIGQVARTIDRVPGTIA
jgi:hypothetical protein